MVQLETWFIIIIAVMSGVILFLTFVVIVLCVMWKRRDKRRKQKEALKQPQTASENRLVETESLSFLDLYETNKSNWVMQERTSNDNIYSPGSLARTTAAGDEPFIAGKSLVQYSHQLNTTEPSYQQAFGTRQQSTRQMWDNEGPAIQPYFNETPNKAEEKMVSLGMIPPRPVEVNGQRRSSSNASSFQRPSSQAKNWKRNSKELEGESIYRDRQASFSGNEVRLWPGAVSQATYTIPEADYNTERATWYPPMAPNGQTSNSVYTPSSNYAKHGPSHNVSIAGESNGVSKIEVASAPPKDFTDAIVEQQSPWTGNEFTTQSEKQKLNRVKRIGVPILPD